MSNGKRILTLLLSGVLLSGCSLLERPAPHRVVSPQQKQMEDKLQYMADNAPGKAGEARPDQYPTAGLSDTADYHCPRCGRKTTYSHTTALDADGAVSQQTAARKTMEQDKNICLVNSLKPLRKGLKEIAPLAQKTGYSITLDESTLCSSCGRGETPELWLTSRNPEGKTTLSEYRPGDEELLVAFFKGQPFHGYHETPLTKSDLERVARIMDLKLEETKSLFDL